MAGGQKSMAPRQRDMPLYAISMSLFARPGLVLGFLACLTTAASSAAQASTPSHADLLRGNYGEYRANNDLLSYALDIRVDPEKHFISGSNRVRFKMLQDGTRIQLDLSDA